MRRRWAGVRHSGHHDHHPEADQGLVGALAHESGPRTIRCSCSRTVIGFYEFRDRGDHMGLLRVLLRPELLGGGYGRRLWDHAVTEAARSHERLLINSDPGAAGFYRATEQKRSTVGPVPGFVIEEFGHTLTPNAADKRQ